MGRSATPTPLRMLHGHVLKLEDVLVVEKFEKADFS
jgi:hypothetical protein